MTPEDVIVHDYPTTRKYLRRTELSVTRVTKAVFPNTTNHHNTLFGGTALAWMDEVSFIAATRFCRLPLVTVSTDRIDFKPPDSRAGSIVELVGTVIKVGNTSLQVQVDVFVENMYLDGRERAIHGGVQLRRHRRGQAAGAGFAPGLSSPALALSRLKPLPQGSHIPRRAVISLVGAALAAKRPVQTTIMLL
ncbi:thioesterase superfamily protein [Pseudomonas putida S11]|nr:thioesterase superfamily protein [Pseudomonas putida S11]